MIHYAVSGGLCVLRLDAPPLNTITLELLDGLRALVRRAIESSDVRAIVIAGREDHFSAGADIHLFQAIASREDAVRLSRRFQEAFQEIEDSPKPVVAAVAGRVLGGALELALACHYREAAEGSRFALPEVNLGILPGAGGTQRLPRLVGLKTGLRMLLRAETVDAAEALRVGLIDAVAPGERLIERASEVARGGEDGVRRGGEDGVRRGSPTPPKAGDVDGAAGDLRSPVSAGSETRAERSETRAERSETRAEQTAALAAGSKMAEAARPELLAPRKIVEVVRTGIDVSLAAGLLAEQQALADCLLSPAAQNKVYLFFATRGTAKVPELDGVQPREIARTAVVGMGTMGTGIVQALACAGLEVAVLDQYPAVQARGVERIRASLQRRVAEGKLAESKADAAVARIRPADGWADLAGADLVIESVFEEVEVKRAVFRRLAEVCGPGAILATNTSTLTLEAIAEGMPGPHRLAGLHFFNPAHVMPLVEVIHGEDTPPETLAALLALVKRLRKTPALVRSREGFVVNRIFVPYVQEAFWLLEEGASPEAVDAAMRAFGFPMGPLELIDMAGLDILVDAQAVLARAFPWHGPLSQVAIRLVGRGMRGQKSGAGVYRYQPGDRTPLVNPATMDAVREAQRAAGRPSRAIAEPELTDRLVLRMVGEAFCALEEHVARGQADLDAASVLGIGFPDFRGGVLKYAADLGLGRVRERLAVLAQQHGPRFVLSGNVLELGPI